LRGTPVSFILVIGAFRTYSVPVGQTLIIEYVSGECVPSHVVGDTTSWDSPQINVSTSGVGATYILNLPIPFTTATGAGFQPFGNLVKIYADGGTAVTSNSLGTCRSPFPANS